MTKFLNISRDETLGGINPYDNLVVSQKAIKTYVDNTKSDLQTQINAKQDALTAGTGISINQNTDTISAVALVINDYTT